MIGRISMLTGVLMCLASPAWAASEIQVPDHPFQQGEAVPLRVLDAEGAPVPNAEIQAEYYPATELTRMAPACTTDLKGVCEWTPELAGIVRLRAGNSDHAVAVRYASIP